MQRRGLDQTVGLEGHGARGALPAVRPGNAAPAQAPACLHTRGRRYRQEGAREAEAPTQAEADVRAYRASSVLGTPTLPSSYSFPDFQIAQTTKRIVRATSRIAFRSSQPAAMRASYRFLSALFPLSAPLAERKSARLSSRSPRLEALALFAGFPAVQSFLRPSPAYEQSPDSFLKRPGSATQATMAGAVLGPRPGTRFSVLTAGIFLVCLAIIRHAPMRSRRKPSSCL